MLMIFSGNSCRHGQRNVAEERSQRWRCKSIPNRTQTGQNRQTKLTKPVLPFTVSIRNGQFAPAAPGTAAIFIAESEGTTHEHTPSRFYRNPAGPAARARRHPTRDGTHADWRAAGLARAGRGPLASPSPPCQKTTPASFISSSTRCSAGRTATRSRSPSSNCSNTR